jgi:SAM-dependent methyltransferase
MTPSTITKILRHLRRRFIDEPGGFGRPIDKDALDREYASGHWDHFFSYDELPRQLVLAGTLHHFHPGGSVLDLGCGSGRLAQLCQVYRFQRYLGADLSSEGIAKARALNLPGVEFLEADFESWRPSQCFDAISFNECIGYARDPAALLRDFSRHLTPAGLFFISHHRFGRSDAQWRRMETVCRTRAATAVQGARGNIWDIRVLTPHISAPGGCQPHQ